MTLNLFVLSLKATNYKILQALCDESQQTAHLVLRTVDLPSGEFVRLLESVDQFAKKNAPEGVAVSAETGLHTILQADREIVDAQLSSLAITLISMLVVMAMLWRSARLAALALGVSLVPLAVLAMLAAGFAVPVSYTHLTLPTILLV